MNNSARTAARKVLAFFLGQMKSADLKYRVIPETAHLHTYRSWSACTETETAAR
jgi:hypothetical protein